MRGLARLATLWTRPRPVVGATPADEVHHENKWRLMRFRPRAAGARFRTPILLVPSLINRHYVLDLMPGKSFAEFLVGEGHDVWVVEWGTPGDEDRHVGLDDVCDRTLGRALGIAARASGARGAHLFGYCMGGTIAAIHAAARPERVASLTLVAAPVRFSDGGLLSAWARTPSFDVAVMVRALGNVPWPLMQSAFHLLRPTLALQKAVHLVERAWDDEFLDGFFALETWGNDNVSLPGAFYVSWIEELYRRDALANGTLVLSGRPARLESIACPLLAVTFEHDNIVPWPTAALVMDRVASPDRERIHLPGGHVGAMVSRSAKATLWPKLSGWWAARDQSVVRRRRARTGTSRK
ncbi:MAG: alpha/beta fold hydrolase [Deltaproteobacteria bacterium]|nr:alpha/beta fold hydrolase [Deltaproteobacteria bacterium]